MRGKQLQTGRLRQGVWVETETYPTKVSGRLINPVAVKEETASPQQRRKGRRVWRLAPGEGITVEYGESNQIASTKPGVGIESPENRVRIFTYEPNPLEEPRRE